MPIPAVKDSSFGDKLINDYIKAFSTASFKNETYGKISLHVILGQALKNVHYVMGTREIDIRIHMLLIKPQGSGKGAGYGFIKKMAQDLEIDFQSLTEATDAGLIGTIDRDESTKENIIIPGLLFAADIVGMEEASVLFDYTSDFSKKNMTYMQITMNALADSSCHITKRLGSEIIDFKPHASFLLMTYPPDKLVDKLLKTGFIDRVIPIFEDVTLMDRLEVIKIMSENINKGNPKDLKKQRDDVLKRLNTIISKFQKGKIKVNISQDVHKIVLSVIEEFAMKILDASPKAREKLEHFTSRLYEILLKLSIHHAILSNRTDLDISDIIYARITYLPIWRNVIISIESLLLISPIDRQRQHSIIRNSVYEYERQIKLNKVVKQKVWVRRLTMVEELQDKWDNCSKETADNNLYKLEKIYGKKHEKFGNIANYEKDKFFERKYIGDIAYLKKIKEIK